LRRVTPYRHTKKNKKLRPLSILYRWIKRRGQQRSHKKSVATGESLPASKRTQIGSFSVSSLKVKKTRQDKLGALSNGPCKKHDYDVSLNMSNQQLDLSCSCNISPSSKPTSSSISIPRNSEAILLVSSVYSDVSSVSPLCGYPLHNSSNGGPVEDFNNSDGLFLRNYREEDDDSISSFDPDDFDESLSNCRPEPLAAPDHLLVFHQSAVRERVFKFHNRKRHQASWGDFDPNFTISFQNFFFISCRRLRRAQEALDEKFAEWSLDTTQDPRPVELAVQKRDNANHHCFREFARGMGCIVAEDTTFIKAAADKALGDLLGTADFPFPSSSTFQYPGIILPSKLPDGSSVELIAFSLYMGRKVFAPVNPLHMPDPMRYYQKMTTPPATTLPKDAVTFFTRLARILCRRPKDFLWSSCEIPASPKSCIEVSSLHGGKRSAIYVQKTSFFEDLRAVIAKTIYTGGKLRDVTIASSRCHKFTVINKLMGNRLRKFKSSIFGREIEDWVEDVIDNVRMCYESYGEDFLFCSGDLKDATNLLHNMIAQIFCEQIKTEFDLDEEDAEALDGYTYRARYYRRQGPFVKKVRACGCLNSDRCDHFLEQVGGWNMGSDISFPILCASTLYCLIKSSGRMEDFLKIVNHKEQKEWLENFDEGGFNGDDVICWPRGGPRKWMEAVYEINGVPEPAKSPCSRSFLTVNSRLFKFDGRDLKAVRTIHPGKLVSVLGGDACSPDTHWKDLALSCPEYRVNLSIDLALRPTLPRALGGIGLFEPMEISDREVVMALFSRLTQPATMLTDPIVFGGEENKEDVMNVRGYVSVDREQWTGFLARHFRTRKSIYWRNASVKRIDNTRILDRISLLLGDRDLVEKYKKNIKIYWASERKNRVILKDPGIPWHIPFEEESVSPALGFEDPIKSESISEPVRKELERIDKGFDILPVDQGFLERLNKRLLSEDEGLLIPKAHVPIPMKAKIRSNRDNWFE